MPAFRNRVDRLAEEAGFYKLSKNPADERLVALPEDLYLLADLILRHHTELILAKARDAMPRRPAK